MAKKVFTGKVVSDKMTKTIVVEIERLVSHPVYKKMVKRTSRLKADTNGKEIKMGQFVKIEQASPISGSKNFIVTEVVKEIK